MDTAESGTRYITDVPYTRRFVRQLAPAWLDFTALICGVAPPERENGFDWCELGCGQGVTPALLAATHAKGRFLGVDLMPDHVAFGGKLCRDAGIANAEFLALDFAAAAERDLPPFDYIVAHGVYSWVDARAKADLRRFVDRHLKPGGLVYLSYNALPGWASETPIQNLLASLARRAKGDGIARFLEADRIAAAMAESGAGLLRSGWYGQDWDDLRGKLPEAYFVHEFLPPAWRPLYVTEVRHDLAEIGLAPVGSATIRENVDAYVLKQAQRDLLATVADADLRELMRDYFLAKRFRRDVFARAPQALDERESRNRIAEGSFMLSDAGDTAESSMATEAGTVTFANPVARRILEFLADGPGKPGALAAEGHSPQNVVANILVLAAAGRIWPVGPDTADCDGINATIRERGGGPDAVSFTALPAGTAVERSTLGDES